MKDTEILDHVVWALEQGVWSDCERNRRELIDYVKRQREDEALVERITKEVARQLKAQKKHNEAGKTENPKPVRGIIKELETEVGSAHIDEIIKRAAKLGVKKDEVEAEIAELLQTAAIFEPVRYSQNYRTSQAY